MSAGRETRLGGVSGRIIRIHLWSDDAAVLTKLINLHKTVLCKWILIFRVGWVACCPLTFCSDKWSLPCNCSLQAQWANSHIQTSPCNPLLAIPPSPAWARGCGKAGEARWRPHTLCTSSLEYRSFLCLQMKANLSAYKWSVFQSFEHLMAQCGSAQCRVGSTAQFFNSAVLPGRTGLRSFLLSAKTVMEAPSQS